VLDERSRHVALVRAQAALIADSSRRSAGWFLSPGSEADIVASQTQSRAPRDPRRHQRPDAHVLEAAGHRSRRAHRAGRSPGLALMLPGFQVHRVTVVGTHLLTTAAVVAAAEVPEQSIFILNGAAIQRGCRRSPGWPARWSQPSCRRRWRSRWWNGHRCSASVATAPTCSSPRTEQPCPGSTRRRSAKRYPGTDRRPRRVAPGHQPGVGPAAQLDRANDSTRVRLLGGRLSVGGGRCRELWTSTGWRAVLATSTPRRDHGAAGADRDPRRLKGRLNFVKPSFGYIDLEAAPYPVSGGHPGSPRR